MRCPRMIADLPLTSSLAPGPLPTEPDDLDEEEIAAYAAEAELNLDELQAEDIFSLSDLDDVFDNDVDML